MKLRDLFYILILTLISIAFFGFYISIGDDQLYIPALLSRINPNLFPNDYLYLEPLKTFTFITDIEILLMRLFNNNLVYSLFTLYFVAKFLLYLGIYRLSFTIFKSRLASFAAIFVLFAPIILPRFGLPSYEVSVIPRMLIYGPALLYFSFLLEKKYVTSVVMFALVVLFHPTSAVHIAVLSILVWFASLKQISNWQKVKISLIGLIVIFTFLVKQFAQQNNYHFEVLNMTQCWYEYLRYRATYLFFSRWRPKDFEYLGYILSILITFLVIAKSVVKVDKRIILSILIFSLGVFVCMASNYFFVDLHTNPFFVRMEMLRTMWYWLYFGLIGISGLLVVATLKNKSILSILLCVQAIIAITTLNPAIFSFWFMLWLLSIYTKITDKTILTFSVVAVFLMSVKYFPNPNVGFYPRIFINLILLATPFLLRRKIAEAVTIFCVLLGSTYFFVQIVKMNYPPEVYYGGINKNKIYWREYLSQKVYFPKLPTTDWINAQLWVKENLQISETLLVPAIVEPGSLMGFRVFSQRSIAYDAKDGAIGTYSEKFASQWMQRDIDLKENDTFPLEKIIEMSKKYKFNYVLRTKQNERLDLPVIYSNNSYLIYRII